MAVTWKKNGQALGHKNDRRSLSAERKCVNGEMNVVAAVLVNWGRHGKVGDCREWENVVGAVVSVFGASFENGSADRREKRFPNQQILVRVEG